ncbi:MAG: hypothetical protein AVDCRST_MAG34-1162 [uncultured Nocardioidaceae bacterium]|uniref:Uncharacterized protein n=1 Tax=uncultured Nocardioidaceae bacterium TaxID=253824 RepID=A0A6J4M075_9ACTN|nr:MAG: hypothetical protein AVDCRST_MAG34-1162 [uncultured Nocardioidaceae bacterium]
MELLDYRKMRTGIQLNAVPAGSDDVRPVAERLRDSLAATGLFGDVEVDVTDNADALVIAMCTFPEGMSAGRLAHWLEQLWQQRLSDSCWEAHATLVDDDQVEFLGATKVSVDGHYLTLHVVAQRGAIPAQRTAAE